MNIEERNQVLLDALEAIFARRAREELERIKKEFIANAVGKKE